MTAFSDIMQSARGKVQYWGINIAKHIINNSIFKTGNISDSIFTIFKIIKLINTIFQ